MTAPLTSRQSHASGDSEVGSDEAAAFVRRHPQMVTFGRIGWVAKGVVYALTGALALKVGTDQIGGSQDTEEANQSGAISKIAQQQYGPTLLVLLAIGLFVYAAWRLVTVLLPADNEGKAWLNRIGYVVSAIVYIALGLSALSLARNPGQAGETEEREDAKVEQLTADVLGWSGGRYLIGLVALVVIAIGVAFAWKGIGGSFAKQVENRGVGPFSWKAIHAMGVIGWVGRGAMMGLIGWFLMRAAVEFDASEAHGLDESLRRVSDSTLGTVLVLVVAVGLMVYGAFCLVTVPTVKLVASDDRTAAA
jgi:hypothetical protein